jgi:protein SPT2
MTSFQELEAIAAKRASDAQAKLVVERAERLRREKEGKAKADQEARLRAQRERDAIVARELRKRKEAEAKMEVERKRKEMAERAAKQREADARGRVSTSSPMMVQARKFADAKKKAIERAGSSSQAIKRADEYGTDWRENETKASRGSTLTREEKRLKQQAMMLGLGESSSRSNKRKRARLPSANKVPPIQDLIPVGLVKRDHRSIDEIERDLQLAKAGKSVASSDANGHKASMVPPMPRNPAAAKVQSAPKERNHFGLSPADYLPGAPLRTGVKLPQPRKKEKEASSANRTAKKPRNEAEPSPPKRETARDRFQREEEERKRQRAKLADASKRFEEDSEISEEDDGGSSGLYDDDDDDEEEAEDGDVADYRDEIWKMFGRNRKEYVNRMDDSDDDDMEADLESVAREEARSARIARLEDEREERELQKRAAQKAAKKAAAKVRP